MKKTLFLTVILLLALIISCKKKNEVGESITNNLASYIQSDSDLSLLNAVIVKVTAARVFQPDVAYTLFAPNNAAFRTFLQVSTDADGIAKINAISPDTLFRYLTYHILKAKARIAELPANAALATLRDTTANNHGRVFIRKILGNNKVNEATIITSDVESTNGIIHKIDKVLVEPTNDLITLVRNNPNLTIFAALLDRTGFAKTVSQLGPYTLLAPSDASLYNYFRFLDPAATTFKVLADSIRNLSSSQTALYLTPILQSHILSANKVLFAQDFINVGIGQSTLNVYSPVKGLQNNGGISLQGSPGSVPAKIILADQLADNGVLQELDAIITTPLTLFQTIAKDPDLSIFTAVLTRTYSSSTFTVLPGIPPHLSTVINSPGNFTVFAPTNKALNKYFSLYFGAGHTNDEITQDVYDTEEQYLEILGIVSSTFQYHVISDSTLFSAADLPEEGYVYTIEGVLPLATIDLPQGSTFGRVFINKITGPIVLNGISKIVQQDLKAVNGVYHKIDSVLVKPLDYDALSSPSSLASNCTVWQAACDKTGITTMLGGLGPFTLYVPSDDAFNAFFGLQYTVQSIAKINSFTSTDIEGVLKPLLLAHILANNKLLYNTLITNSQTWATLYSTVNLSIVNKTVTNGKNSAKIILPDIQTTNGVFNVIDKVLAY